MTILEELYDIVLSGKRYEVEGAAQRALDAGVAPKAIIEETLRPAMNEVGERFSRAPHYPEVNRAAVKEMHRQVGDLVLDENGVALRGLLVRHLVLPEGLAGTGEIVRFLADQISTDTYINIMDQYRPCYNAAGVPPLNRRITPAEYREAVRMAQEAGLHRLDDRLARGLLR